MTEQPKDPKTDLLDELESIKHLLEDDDIPLLQEVIDDIESSPAFSEPHSGARRAPVTRASGENPFLPKHIRERLKSYQQAALPLEPEPPTPTPPAQTASAQSPNRAELVNNVIKALQPDIEKRLRQQLAGLSVEELRGLLGDK